MASGTSIFVLLVACVLATRAEPDSLMTTLLARIDRLEHQVRIQGEQLSLFQGQEERLERQEKLLEEQRNIIDKQQEALEQQSTLIDQLLGRVGDVEAQISSLLEGRSDDHETPSGAAMDEPDDSHDTDDGQSDRLHGTVRKDARRKENVQRRVTVGTAQPVAFLARRDENELHMGLGQNVLFDVVVTNIGGGYHSSHGLFIAPVGGIYIFSVSIASFSVDKHPWLEVDILKNGQILTRAISDSDGYGDQGSTNAVTQLAPADEVWVTIHLPPADAYVYGFGMSSFMGCLIQAL